MQFTLENLRKWIDDWLQRPESVPYRQYLEGVKCPWDCSEILVTNLVRKGLTEFIIRPELDIFETVEYCFYIKLEALAKILGYATGRHMFSSGHFLNNYPKYYLNDLKVVSPEVKHLYESMDKNDPANRCFLLNGPPRVIIPQKLDNMSGGHQGRYVYVDTATAIKIIHHAEFSGKFRSEAGSLLDSINLGLKLSSKIIPKLVNIINTQQKILIEHKLDNLIDLNREFNKKFHMMQSEMLDKNTYLRRRDSDVEFLLEQFSADEQVNLKRAMIEEAAAVLARNEKYEINYGFMRVSEIKAKLARGESMTAIDQDDIEKLDVLLEESDSE